MITRDFEVNDPQEVSYGVGVARTGVMDFGGGKLRRMLHPVEPGIEEILYFITIPRNVDSVEMARKL